MPPRQHFPVRLTLAQRKVVAEIAPELADRLKLDERNQRTIPFTLAELRAIKEKASRAIRQASTGVVRNSLRHVTDLTAQALDRSRGLGAIAAAERAYQLKGTRSRPEGDRRSDTNKVRQLERIVHSTVPEAPLNAPRRVGPTRARHFGLRSHVDKTEARNAQASG